MAKTIANRLRKGLNAIITPFQTAFILGRCIQDSIIVTHEAIHGLKEKKRSKNHSLPIDELYDISDKKNLEASYIQQEQNITLYHALENVNTDYSQALHLVYIEGLSISEAAEIMHKSKKQMENLICRGKKAMRAELEKEGFVYEGLYAGK